MAIRAKLQLQSVKEYHWSKENKEYTFQAVYDDGTPENSKFAKSTPSGNFTMVCNNPAVQEQLQLGKIYYFDIVDTTEV